MADRAPSLPWPDPPPPPSTSAPLGPHHLCQGLPGPVDAGGAAGGGKWDGSGGRQVQRLRTVFAVPIRRLWITTTPGPASPHPQPSPAPARPVSLPGPLRPSPFGWWVGPYHRVPPHTATPPTPLPDTPHPSVPHATQYPASVGPSPRPAPTTAASSVCLWPAPVDRGPDVGWPGGGIPIRAGLIGGWGEGMDPTPSTPGVGLLPQGLGLYAGASGSY
mmetsp:Transcript_44355/g.79559  ORF Transcript_44355/g.79559 Transcript_44355/m.79559 type:complete len:218 (-) Transcript_44355:659-1312(-)